MDLYPRRIHTTTIASKNTQQSLPPSPLATTKRNYGSIVTMTVQLDSLPLPLALRPLVRRLIALPESDVSDDDILAIIFIVRIADAMHKKCLCNLPNQVLCR